MHAASSSVLGGRGALLRVASCPLRSALRFQPAPEQLGLSNRLLPAPRARSRSLAEHDEAIACGATGVPSVRLADNDAVITGAMPFETYRRWVQRTRERSADRVA